MVENLDTEKPSKARIRGERSAGTECVNSMATMVEKRGAAESEVIGY